VNDNSEEAYSARPPESTAVDSEAQTDPCSSTITIQRVHGAPSIAAAEGRPQTDTPRNDWRDEGHIRVTATMLAAYANLLRLLQRLYGKQIHLLKD
jgi:hypothetical protein